MKILAVILLFASCVSAKLFLFERYGAIVSIQDHYGMAPAIIDTVTRIDEERGQWVTYGMYDDMRGSYPSGQYGITIIQRLKLNKEKTE